MQEFCKLYQKYFSNPPQTILEIGSRDGDDADYMSKFFGIDEKKVFLVDPHPDHIREIKKKYPTYSLFPLAISPKSGVVNFNAIQDSNKYVRGQSSILPRKIKSNHSTDNWIEVPSITGIMLFDRIGLSQIDLVKIDVEGYTYEVLISFKEKLKSLNFLHLEVETIQYWSDQKLFTDVFDLLTTNGFQEVYNNKDDNELQFDSFWLNCDTTDIGITGKINYNNGDDVKNKDNIFTILEERNLTPLSKNQLKIRSLRNKR